MDAHLAMAGAVILLGLLPRLAPLPPSPAACLHTASSQPAKQEAGCSPGQLVPVTLYPTRSTLGEQKSEQRPCRWCEAFPCHLRLTAAQLRGFCGFLGSELGPQASSQPGNTASTLFPSHQHCPHPPQSLSHEGLRRSPPTSQ